ncbi:tyrosine-type recombinase/integrase [Romboutsia sp.]|uniref:tyrosine-type recombinase/integrase n=1 Tax=Romboutsia sp. TaxID=1965302 RepID=UPI002C5080A7|nr:tyrosine-type recombinase/integrase [Romboutsia sp.]HSQ87510.1 tyrosine-type recombinase/integrase [Romboutsia sp.]
MNFGLDDDDYSEEFEDCRVNPSRIKGMTKEKVRDIIFLSDEEILYLYDRLIEKGKYQQALFCMLMYDSAGRRNECHQVVKNFALEDENFTNIVVGKRNKKFRLLYRAKTKEIYDLYMSTRKDDCDALWVTRKDGKIVPASYETLYAWVISWRKIVAEKFEYKEFNPHSFRHSSLENYGDGSHYVCREYLGGKKLEIEQLKILAHHEDVSVTMSYLKDKGDDELLSAFGI